MDLEEYNLYYNLLLEYKYQKQDHWDIFDDNYFSIIEKMSNLEYFRRNGVSNMLETGLPSQERNYLLHNNLKYNEDYNTFEIDDIIERFNELVLMLGEDFINRVPFNTNVGSPRKYEYSYNNKNNKIVLNFDDLYNVYAAWQLDRFIKQFIKSNDLNLIIVEIGGGYGNLAHKIKSLYPNSTYIIIDLPEVLLIQHYYLINNNDNYKILNLMNKNITIENFNYDDNENFQQYDIILIPCDMYKNIKIPLDIVINTRSLGEMPKTILYDYMTWIETNIKTSGLFYNVNRYVFTKSEDKNKIRDYPYDDRWMVILSQPQWLQTHLHEFLLQRVIQLQIPIQFLLQSFPIRTPPPGPIMPKIQTQEDWLKYQKVN